MNLTTVAGGMVVVAALWAGIKPLVKRGLYREYSLYAAMVFWSAYLFAAERYNWKPVTAITLMSALIAPLERLLNLMSWLG